MPGVQAFPIRPVGMHISKLSRDYFTARFSYRRDDTNNYSVKEIIFEKRENMDEERLI